VKLKWSAFLALIIGFAVVVCFAIYSLIRLSHEEPRCPDKRGMVYIPAGSFWVRYEGERWKAEGRSDELVELNAFCIDRFEYPNLWLWKPRVKVSWQKAKDLCAKQGERLCAGYEWQKAFGGPEGLRYPYGNEFDQNRCNTYYQIGNRIFARSRARSGIFKRCVSPYGVYDMSGNVSEWTDELWQNGFDDRVLRGGSFNTNIHNCQRLQPNGMWHFCNYSESIGSIHHHPPFLLKDDDGFRCCAEPIKD